MFLGLIMLTASWGVTQNGWVICYAWSLFFYSIGVGKYSTGISLSSPHLFDSLTVLSQVVNIL